MDKKYLVDRQILLFALRYALDRQTFAPTIVIDNIKANIKDMSSSDIKAFIKEIVEDTDLVRVHNLVDWLNFKDYLEKELTSR